MVCEGVAEIFTAFLEIGPFSMRRRVKISSTSMRGVLLFFMHFFCNRILQHTSD
jgi:hypothetical protein